MPNTTPEAKQMRRGQTTYCRAVDRQTCKFIIAVRRPYKSPAKSVYSRGSEPISSLRELIAVDSASSLLNKICAKLHVFFFTAMLPTILTDALCCEKNANRAY